MPGWVRGRVPRCQQGGSTLPRMFGRCPGCHGRCLLRKVRLPGPCSESETIRRKSVLQGARHVPGSQLHLRQR